MGIAASVNVDRENCEQFGDRVEVTKQLPVENFGQDNTESEGAKNGSCQTGDKTFSSGSISEERFRERFTNRPSKSRKSLGSFLGLNYKLKVDEFERTNSDGTSYSAEAADLKIKRLTKKNSELQQEKERLKRELESFRKSSTRWQQESQQAKQYEEQAKERAKVFEDGKW